MDSIVEISGKHGGSGAFRMRRALREAARNDRFLCFCALCALALACGGCRLVSVEEEDVPFFEATVGIVRVEGAGAGRLATEHTFQLWGQFVYPDSSFRFIQFSVANFGKTGTFALRQFEGTYGLIDDQQRTVRFAASAGNREDNVRIDRFNPSGVVQGTFSFNAAALASFDNVSSGAVFPIRGAFLVELP